MGEPIANWVGALGTVVAVFVAVWQLRLNSRAEGENFARGMWNEYLKLGLANPELGESDIAADALKNVKTVEDLAQGFSLGAQRYLWFLTILLDTCEAVIHYLPRTWNYTVCHQIGFHKPVLRLIWNDNHYGEAWGPFYSAELQAVVAKVLALTAGPAEGRLSPERA